MRDEAHPEASVYSQSMEIKESMPAVIAEAEKLGYHIDEMSIGGGSAGHCLAMLYAYRDEETSPVPVKMVFGAVDWLPVSTRRIGNAMALTRKQKKAELPPQDCLA